MLTERRWRFRSRVTGHEYLLPLVLLWEPDGGAMSDDYAGDPEADAATLFRLWTRRYRSQWRDGMVPLTWYVQAPPPVGVEFAPGCGARALAIVEQRAETGWSRAENFLSAYRCPRDPETGTPVNWLRLPVEPGKGGDFIRAATGGWQPAPLTPYAYLPALETAVRWSGPQQAAHTVGGDRHG